MALSLALALLLGLGSCSGTDREVSVLGPWVGAERKSFEKVLERFHEKTGIRYGYQGERAVHEVLQSQVQSGSPPDVAVIWSPNELTKYARTKTLLPLNDVIGPTLRKAYRPEWLMSRAFPGDSNIYTIPIKANLKSMIWFNPAHFPKPWPTTWNDLLDRSRAMAEGGRTPWCMGMADPGASGWPGTDWIEDILLHRSGPGPYSEWAGGELMWTSPEVRGAWEEWGKLIGRPGDVNGGIKGVLLTNFQDAAGPMFDDPPGCVLQHQPSFAMNSFQRHRQNGKAPEPGTAYSFLPFPGFGSSGGTAIQPANISVDLAGMFRDNDQARRLMEFLASDEAQEIWPGLRDGSAFSLNTVTARKDEGAPKDTLSRDISNILTSTERTLCFDASDSFPTTMRNAFTRAVLAYLNDPGKLSDLLGELDRIKGTIPSEEWLKNACSA